MPALLTIGEFARMTHLSVKALRHYDEVGLLAPADVDPASGYRLYTVGQVPAAQAIRRFRDLDMPLDQIKLVLAASDPSQREAVLIEHLRAMEAKLDQTQATVASLRALLEGVPAGRAEHRDLPVLTVLAVRAEVEWDDCETWLDTALLQLHAAAGSAVDGPDGALYSAEFFEAHIGEVVAYLPVAAGTANAEALPGGPHAVVTHDGPFATLDAAYASLGASVTEQGIGAPGPIREVYLDDERTEVCWPIRAVKAG